MALKGKGLLVVLSGPSGCGKDTIIAELKNRSLNMKQSISMTTRAMRSGEKDGVDYYFTDVKSFEKKISEGYFLEYVKYGSNYYGTPRDAAVKIIDEGSSVILKIEVEGAGNVRKFFPEAVSIFIIPPSTDVLKERLRGRGTETKEEFDKRVQIAEDEFKRASEYDYVVINDELSECVDSICGILNAEKSRYARMKETVDEIINNNA